MTIPTPNKAPDDAELRNLAEQQQTALLALLQAQQTCRYGQFHDFASIHDSKDYARLPLMTYDDVAGVEDYWRDRDNFTTDRIAAYFLTSGSSAAPKKIPVTSTLIRQKARAFAAFWEHVYADHPALKEGKFIANFGDSGHSQRNADNIPELSETTFWNQRMQGFQAKDRWPIPRQLTAISNAEHRYYAAARLALQGPLHCLMSLNPSTLVKFCEVF
ncbi:MAG: GH3 auxin-responsive promoter family protein, partial [Pseudomonadota bacterium]